MRQNLGVENMPPLIESSKPKSDGLPKKSGPVSMVQTVKGRLLKNRVVLSVYQSSYDRYAVVSQERIIVKDCGYINLKYCRVENVTMKGLENAFQIIPRKCEGNVLTLSVSNSQELEEWINVLKSDSCDQTSPRNSFSLDFLSSSPPSRGPLDILNMVNSQTNSGIAIPQRRRTASIPNNPSMPALEESGEDSEGEE